MIGGYRASLYRRIFAAAAIYNVAFGLWTAVWPRSFFALLEIAPPNYPGIWQCLGMVVGLYGVLYAHAARRLDLARPIIAVGLAGKILGPIGWVGLVQSGQWPARTLTLLAFNDLVWWLPFALFLLEGTRWGERLRRSAAWACAGLNALAAMALLVLRGGTEAAGQPAQRAAYIAGHVILWRAGWAIWMMAAASLVAFYCWWGARVPSRSWSLAACGVAALGLACDFFAESLWIGAPPERMAVVGPIASVLSGAAANGLYSVAGAMLTLRSRFLSGTFRIWAWVVWASGFALTACTLAHFVDGMIVSTAILMALFCPWVVLAGRKIREA